MKKRPTRPSMAGPKLPLRVPEDDEKTSLSLRPRKRTKRKLAEIARSRGIKVNEVGCEFLEWAIGEWEKENNP